MGQGKRIMGKRKWPFGFVARARAASRTLTMPAVRGRLATKLIAGFLVVLALTAVIGWLGLSVANRASRTTDQIAHQNLDELGAVSEAVELLKDNRESLLEFLIADDRLTRAGLETTLANSDRTIDAFIADFDPDGAREKDLIQQLEVAWTDYKTERDAETLSLVSKGDILGARQTISGVVGQRYALVESSLHQLEDIERGEARALSVEAQDGLRSGRYQVMVALAVAALIGLGVAVWLSRRISQSAGAVASAAEGLAEGDLARRVEVSTGDEIEAMAQAFNAMAERLQAMVEADREIKSALETAVREYSAFASAVAHGDLTVRVETNGSNELTTLTDNLNNMVSGLGTMSTEVLRGAQSLGTAAGQILDAVSEQSATVTEQSAAISQTSVTVDELRASAEQAAQRSLEVADQAQQSAQVSSEGTEVVTEIVQRMEDIKERVEAIAQNILTLSEQTQQISDITATVDDIAEQSNLLALNATIEAARAGEHGKGFAVVAAEVRNLAEQSKQGTAQVRSILGDIQKATNSAVMATEQGIRVVDDGSELAHRAGQAIHQLSQTIRSTAQAAQQISAAAQQQSLAVDQIAESMSDINQAASLFVTGVDESKSAARGLNDLARDLQALTEQYKV
jgi:methyl-accepting chemotaxis protein